MSTCASSTASEPAYYGLAATYKHTAEHKTYLISLNEDWNNRTLNAQYIVSDASGLTCQALFVDRKQNTVYVWGGQLSADGHTKDTQYNPFYNDRLPEVWALSVKPDASGSWVKVVGKNAPTPMPENFQQLACGAYAYDNEGGYYIGGQISHWTTLEISNFTQYFGVPGLVKFDFDTKQITNTTNDGQFFASRNTGLKEPHEIPGPLLNIPFGPNGTLVSIGGRQYPNATDDDFGSGWSNLWIYDKQKNRSYHQPITGDPPRLGLEPDKLAFFSAFDEKNKTFEM